MSATVALDVPDPVLFVVISGHSFTGILPWILISCQEVNVLTNNIKASVMGVGRVSSWKSYIFREHILAEINPIISLKSHGSHNWSNRVWLLEKSEFSAVLICPLSSILVDIKGCVLKGDSIIVISINTMLFSVDSKVLPLISSESFFSNSGTLVFF